MAPGGACGMRLAASSAFSPSVLAHDDQAPHQRSPAVLSGQPVGVGGAPAHPEGLVGQKVPARRPEAVVRDGGGARIAGVTR